MAKWIVKDVYETETAVEAGRVSEPGEAWGNWLFYRTVPENTHTGEYDVIVAAFPQDKVVSVVLEGD